MRYRKQSGQEGWRKGIPAGHQDQHEQTRGCKEGVGRPELRGIHCGQKVRRVETDRPLKDLEEPSMCSRTSCRCGVATDSMARRLDGAGSQFENLDSWSGN